MKNTKTNQNFRNTSGHQSEYEFYYLLRNNKPRYDKKKAVKKMYYILRGKYQIIDTTIIIQPDI